MLGLLFRLLTLYAPRNALWYAVAGLAVVLALAWPRSDPPGPAARPSGLQLAVQRDGFLVSYPTDGGRRVIDVDRDGRERGTMITRRGEDQRIVGTSTGPAVAWEEARKLRFVRIADDRDLGTWGKTVRQLCDGVGSNDQRFAVGWLEGDDTVWIVHGPTATEGGAATDGEAGALELVAPGELVRNDWCGVASAEKNVALFWRSADKLHFGMCTKRRCSGLFATYKLDHRLPILGFGCLSNACLVAWRDDGNHARIALLSEMGRSRWNKVLDTAGDQVSIVGVGVGDGALAVGYLGPAGAAVDRFDRNGTVTALWRDAAATGAPTLSWSSGRLLIARYQGTALAYETIALAR
jgi:hypothetical protein